MSDLYTVWATVGGEISSMRFENESNAMTAARALRTSLRVSHVSVVDEFAPPAGEYTVIYEWEAPDADED